MGAPTLRPTLAPTAQVGRGVPPLRPTTAVPPLVPTLPATPTLRHTSAPSPMLSQRLEIPAPASTSEVVQEVELAQVAAPLAYVEPVLVESGKVAVRKSAVKEVPLMFNFPFC